MSTFPFVVDSDYQVLNLTPEQIAKLEGEPQDLTPKFKKEIARWLHAQGLTKLAIRVDDCSTWWRRHRLTNGFLINENLNPCHEAALCQNCANLRWDQECKRYAHLASILGASFTYVVTTPEAAPQICDIFRKIAPTLSKFCWNEQLQRFEVRILLCAVIHNINFEMLQTIRQIHPAVRIESHPSSEFIAVLNAMLLPILPDDPNDRMVLKNHPKRLRFVGASQALRRKLFEIGTTTSHSNNINTRSHPKNGFCHIAQCREHTQRHQSGIPEQELRWSKAPFPPLRQAA